MSLSTQGFLQFTVASAIAVGVLMLIAYLSNTERLPSWAKDVTSLFLFPAAIAISLGIVLGADAPAILCMYMPVFFIALALVIFRRGSANG